MKIDIKALKQETHYTCLPACIRILLNYLGNDKTESDIAYSCHTTKAGTFLRNAVRAIQNFGYEVAQIQEGTLDDLFQSILHQEPVIVILGVERLPYGDFGTHAVVVIGFQEKDILFIEPASGKEVQMDMLESPHFLHEIPAKNMRE